MAAVATAQPIHCCLGMCFIAPTQDITRLFSPAAYARPPWAARSPRPPIHSTSPLPPVKISFSCGVARKEMAHFLMKSDTLACPPERATGPADPLPLQDEVSPAWR